VVRIDTLLARKSGSSPTGNLFGQLDSGAVVDPPLPAGDATISTGQQTIPFQKVAEIHPRSSPLTRKYVAWEDSPGFSHRAA